MSAETNAFRHAPGCVHASPNTSAGGNTNTTNTNANASGNATEASERDALLRLSLGRSAHGDHVDVYRCRECAAKGTLE